MKTLGLVANVERNVLAEGMRREKSIERALYSASVAGRNGAMLTSAQRAHKNYVKKFMSSLYAFFPVYNKFTVDKDGNFTKKYTIGGNTPIVRELEVEAKIDKITVTNADTGSEYSIETGKNKRYGKINDIVSLSSGKNVTVIKDAISNGLYLDKDMNVVEPGTEGAVKYKIFIWSNSNERNVEALFINAEKFNGNKSMELIDRVSGGSFSANLPTDGEIPFKKFEKVGKRLGILHTPAIKAAKAKHVIFVDGDLLGTDDMKLDSEYLKENGMDCTLEEFLETKGVVNDKNTYDGACYLSEEFFNDCAKELGVEMPAWILKLFAAQNRSEGLMSKVFGEASRQEVLRAIKEYAYLLLERGLVKGVYEIGNKLSPIDMVIDTNGAKLANMDRVLDPNSEGFDVYVLNIAKASISALSGQMIEKFTSMDMNTTLDFIKTHAANKADEILGRKLDKSLHLGRDKFGKLALEGDMIENLITVNKERALADKSVMAKIVTEQAAWQDSAVRKGKVEIDSLYHHVLFDITKMISVDKIDYILGFDKDLMAVQGFSLDVIAKNVDAIAEIEEDPTLTDAEKKSKLDKIMTAVIIKYPTPGKEEFELVRYLTKNELLKLINRAVLKVSATMADDEVKALTKRLRRYFFETSFGVVKLAPLNILKNKLAGMDTDYDAICSIFEPVLVDLAVNKIQTQGFNGSLANISYAKDQLVLPDAKTIEEEVVLEEEVNF